MFNMIQYFVPALRTAIFVLQPLAQALNVVDMFTGAPQCFRSILKFIFANEALIKLPVHMEPQTPDIFLIDFPHLFGIQVVSVLLQGQQHCMGGVSSKPSLLRLQWFLVRLEAVRL
jgi:hypothetical protein